MKTFLIIAFGMMWYWFLVPIAWHADDNVIFGESRKAAAHVGAAALALVPPIAIAIRKYIQRML